MYCFPVAQKDNTQIFIIGFRNLRPSSYAPICLDFLPNRVGDNVLNPFKLNINPVTSLSGVNEILSEFQGSIMEADVLAQRPDESPLQCIVRNVFDYSTSADASTPVSMESI